MGRFSRKVQAGLLPSPGGCKSSQVSTHSFCGQESPKHGPTTAGVPRTAPCPSAQPGWGLMLHQVLGLFLQRMCPGTWLGTRTALFCMCPPAGTLLVAPQAGVTSGCWGSRGRWDAEHRGAPRHSDHSSGHG